ncbi:MAG: type I restriction endonuclease subunit R [Clostridiales bacterium]|nr:type I restriction endonuclease subunit R [Clostridiales bacterium]
MDTTEKRFEQDIETYLLSEAGGYIKGSMATYDKSKAIDLLLLKTFIANTQKKAWERFCNLYGDNADKQLYKRFDEEVQSKGLIHVLRNGVKDRGIELRFCYFAPASGNNPELVDKYNNNILTCTRQLYYSTQNTNSIDMVLSLNGIPVVAIELKNQLKGQCVENAKVQFMHDRDPKELLFNFNRRILVYFAADLYEVWMTTRLDKEKTVFLPFNQGSDGAGNIGDAGNPAPKNEDDYITAYFWQNVLQKDALLALLQRYVSVQGEEKTKIENGRRVTHKTAPKIIFPRYHQYDVVEKLIADVESRGAGKNYLIQHSAGSGKSNSIAWLTYRLATLHNANEEDVFSSVFVVTDRRVLNRQLQSTVLGFDHKEGQIVTITDKDNSDALRQAIEDGMKIIITTLPRFPIIYKEVGAQRGKNFAVIVDEAHSSQSGNSAKKLKAVLADTDEAIKEYADINELTEEEVDATDDIVLEMLTQGKHNNLSFFAFTATPKPKTLELFGELQPDGSYTAFHHYSMRQAIAEGFILDVLQNYSTIENTWEIAKKIKENPEYDETPAMMAIRKYQKNHEHVLQQKVEIIVEQFRQVTLSKLDGKAKAMVVSSSRWHAVKYYQLIKEYCKKKGYVDVCPLVAFSGEVKDDGAEYTESKLNSTDQLTISESQLPDYFASDAYNLLVVADKYQTGFDEPKLHTMFVDKALRGVKAVQTLSRLNRTCKNKVDTYVLDFVNSPEVIEKSFQTFYEDTKLVGALDVNTVYSYYDKTMSFSLWLADDVEKFATLYTKKGAQGEKDLGKLTACVKSAVNGYNSLAPDKQDEFRSALKNFLRFYAYVSQITRMFDAELHKAYLFCEYLFRLLPKRPHEKINLDDQILLVNSKLTETFSGSIELKKGTGAEIKPESRTSVKRKIEKKDLLENIIEKINLMYQGQFTDADRVIVETIFDRMFHDSKKLRKHAQNSDEEMFARSIFPDEFEKIAEDCYAESMDSFAKLFENKEFYDRVMAEMARAMYYSLRNKKD